MSDDHWVTYDRWNQAMAQRFFSPAAKHRPVYLDVDDDLIVELGQGIGVSPETAKEHYRQAVADTLILAPFTRPLLYKHRRRLKEWLESDRPGAPPFVALLALFCNVAENMKRTGDVAPHNYYTPLTRELGLPLTEEHRNHVQKGFREADRLWGELNRWLENLEGERGLPTANPLDRRVHIGFPLSQALLREKDRRRLPELFMAHGLRPQQEVLPHDMERLMADWVPRSSLSSVAKNLWRKPEARRRMAEIASVELASWDGSDIPTGGPGTARIELVASFRTRPRPRIDFAAVVRRRADVPEGVYKVSPAGTGLPLDDGSERNEVTLTAGLYPEWFENLPPVSVPDLLCRRVVFTTADGSVSLEWGPRRIVVFQLDEAMMRFRSQARLELNQPSMLLVEQRLADRVDSVLQDTVLPGLAVHTPDQVEGLPEGWCLFTDVVLVGVPDPGEDPDLGTLIPYAWTSVTFSGGLSVPGIGTWLTSALPVLTVASVEEVTRLSVEVTENHLLGRFPWRPPGPVVSQSGTLTLDLSSLGLFDGDYRLSVSAKIKGRELKVASRSLRARSANHVRPVGGTTQWCGHALTTEDPFAAISAETRPEAPAGSRVQGALTSGAEAPPSSAGVTPRVDLPEVLGISGPCEPEDERGPAGPTAMMTSEDMNCLFGVHHWKIAPAHSMQDFYRPHKGQCIKCGLTKSFPARPKASGVSPRPPQTQRAPAPEVVRPKTVESQEDGNRYDDLLDAACYVQTGEWGRFEFLASQLSDEPWFAHETGRLFSSLGHIDIEYDRLTLRPKRWAVAPATIVILSLDEPRAVLAGFRSRRLVWDVAEAAELCGGRMYRERPAGGPAVFRIDGLDRKALAELADLVADSVPAGVHLAEPAATALLGRLPSLRHLVDCLPETWPPVDIAVRRFAPSSARWVDAEDTTLDGLYQFQTRPVKLDFKAGCHYCRIESRLGKYMAAAASGVYLLAYERARQRLLCPVGAQLPGLYERAAVLCSGRPPSMDGETGTMVYEGVPPSVASALWSLLSVPGWSAS